MPLVTRAPVSLKPSAILISMTGGIRIRVARASDCRRLAELRAELWPEASVTEHAQELTALLNGARPSSLPSIHFVAEGDRGQLIGFLEAGLRSHADGCDPAHPVGFIEGWYVAEHYRRQGIGRRLVAAAEDWACSQGCLEMASDTWVDHDPSQRAHTALGYQEVDRCVHYRKLL